jgi:hypothetical protein
MLLGNAIGGGDGWNTISKMAGRVQFNGRLVRQEQADQMSDIVEYLVQEIGRSLPGLGRWDTRGPGAVRERSLALL